VLLRTFLLTALLVPAAARAEVQNLSEGGFVSRHQAEVAATPAAVYRTLTERIDEWWEGAHSWSGDAANLYFEARVGGCFCERLENGGGAEHLRVVLLWPNRQVRLEGALGPLGPMGLAGTMNWVLEETGSGGTRFTWTYVVRGHMAGDYAALADAVDAVNGTQFNNLVALAGGI
jgi:uncharacterized protein YndB with AHSA1/START domain